MATAGKSVNGSVFSRCAFAHAAGSCDRSSIVGTGAGLSGASNSSGLGDSGEGLGDFGDLNKGGLHGGQATHDAFGVVRELNDLFDGPVRRQLLGDGDNFAQAQIAKHHFEAGGGGGFDADAGSGGR